MKDEELSKFFRSVGGTPIVQAGADPNDPEAVTWNFGLLPATMQSTEDSNVPTFYEMFPLLQGRWDGKTPINHMERVRKVLGKDIEAQQQPRGTCGGRAGSLATDILQCILITTGKRAKFYKASHAWLYFLARREYRMLSGGDGVADGSIPPVMAKYGVLHRQEAGDEKYAGSGSDSLAVRWGGGGMSKSDETRFIALAKDNIVTVTPKVRSASELADAIASGGVAVCSDNQGYTTTRDSDGFCKPRGSWSHYHVRSGVLNKNGRKGFVYNQSWGENSPDGTKLEGYPGNCFGVDWDVQDRLCRNGSVHVAMAFDLWDLEKEDIPYLV